MAREVFIVGSARTPIGSFQGALSDVTAPRLGAVAIKAALERAKLAAESVDETFMGNVLTAGEGQAPARQAAKYAGVPHTRDDGRQGVWLGLQASSSARKQSRWVTPISSSQAAWSRCRTCRITWTRRARATAWGTARSSMG